MNHPSITPEERFATIVEEFLGEPFLLPDIDRTLAAVT